MAAFAKSLTMIWLGYSLIFGGANGLGYGFGLQISAQVNPKREGLAMGTVTAAYAFGSVIAPGLLDIALESGGVRLAMLGLAICLVLVGGVAFLLLQKADFVFLSEPRDAIRTSLSKAVQRLLWFGYFGSVLAGLMVIGHAAAIARAAHPDIPPWVAPVVIAAFNLSGSFLGGRLADSVTPGRLLALLALTTSAGLVTLLFFESAAALLLGLSFVGFAYGGTIAAFPAAIAKLAGPGASARIYGRVFTAWGAAGLAGPWLAGVLFDAGGGYDTSLAVAAAIGVLAAGVIHILFRRSDLRLA
nr:MFS transporter [Roseovarius aestuariivivens]